MTHKLLIVMSKAISISAFTIIITVVVGIFISRKPIIVFFSTYTPLQVMIIKWLVIISVITGIFILASAKAPPKHQLGVVEGIATSMLLFALSIVLMSWLSSELPALYTGIDKISPFHIASEDGIVFYYTYRLAQRMTFPMFIWDTPIGMAADFTYVVIPAILMMVAFSLVRAKRFATITTRQMA